MGRGWNGMCVFVVSAHIVRIAYHSFPRILVSQPLSPIAPARLLPVPISGTSNPLWLTESPPLPACYLRRLSLGDPPSEPHIQSSNLKSSGK